MKKCHQLERCSKDSNTNSSEIIPDVHAPNTAVNKRPTHEVETSNKMEYLLSKETVMVEPYISRSLEEDITLSKKSIPSFGTENAQPNSCYVSERLLEAQESPGITSQIQVNNGVIHNLSITRKPNIQNSSNHTASQSKSLPKNTDGIHHGGQETEQLSVRPKRMFLPENLSISGHSHTSTDV